MAPERPSRDLQGLLGRASTDAGCYFSDTAAATDTAVADGVDIVSYSIGTAFDYVDPTDIAFLFAANAGVFVSRSAGNDGPGPETTAAGEPWAMTVAASTTSGARFANATGSIRPRPSPATIPRWRARSRDR